MSEYSKYSYYEFSHLNIHVINIMLNSRIALDSKTYRLAKHFFFWWGRGRVNVSISCSSRELKLDPMLLTMYIKCESSCSLIQQIFNLRDSVFVVFYGLHHITNDHCNYFTWKTFQIVCVKQRWYNDNLLIIPSLSNIHLLLISCCLNGF